MAKKKPAPDADGTLESTSPEGDAPDAPTDGTATVAQTDTGEPLTLADLQATEQQLVDASAARAPTDAPPWGQVAFVRRGLRCYFGAYLTHLPGGTFVTEPDRVRSLAPCEAVELVDVASPEHLEHVLAQHARGVAMLSELAEQLGYVVVPHGDARLDR